jgi:hypothetical protein
MSIEVEVADRERPDIGGFENRNRGIERAVAPPWVIDDLPDERRLRGTGPDQVEESIFVDVGKCYRPGPDRRREGSPERAASLVPGTSGRSVRCR